MPFLDQLNITNATPTRDRTPIGRFRRRLAESIRAQIQLANADRSGVPLTLTRQRWVRPSPGAAKELKQVPIRLKRWWWKDDAGKTFLSLKSGSRLLEIAPGKKAIEVGNVDELTAKLEILCEAVVAGELDACAKDVARPIARADKEKAPPAPKPPQASKEAGAKAH